MTAFDRFDPFEQRISVALEDIAVDRAPDYLDDVFGVTARTAQRPRWSFPERWLPMDLTARQPAFLSRLPVRPLVLLIVLALLAVVLTAVWIGTRQGPQLPPPFGPAGNGQIAFGMSGDLYALDSLTSEPRLLVSAPGEQGAVLSSPNGLLIAYSHYERGIDHAWVANADGSNPRQVLDVPFTGLGASWSPNSMSLALVSNVGAGDHQLWLAPADGSGARAVDLGTLEPWDVVFDPQHHDVMLIRAEDGIGGPVDLYYIDTNGVVLSKIDMTGGTNLDGAEYEYAGIAFSPNGETVAYNFVGPTEEPFNRIRVHLMERDGTNDRPVGAPLETLYSQAWADFSPDGKWIAMESWETGSDGLAETRISRLAVAPTDGSAPARWLGPSEIGQTLVKTWSPDGSYILVGMQEFMYVYAIDPETGKADKLPWRIELPDVQRVFSN